MSLEHAVRSRPSLAGPFVRFAENRGIFYGWIVVAASFIVSFCEMTTYNPTLSLFILPMSKEFGWSRSEFTGAILMATFSAAAIAPFMGRLIDRVGPRPVLIVATGVLAIFIGALGLVAGLLQFYVTYSIARITGTTSTALSNTVVVSSWFLRRRSLALGIMVTSWRVAGFILPIVLAWSIGAYGWRAGWFGLGVMVAVLGILPPILLIVRRPEDIGLHPDGDRQPPSKQQIGSDFSWTLKEAMGTRALWLLALSGFCAWYPGAAYNLHIVPYLTEEGFSAEIAVGVLSSYGLVSAITAVGFGFVADRIGVRWTAVIVYLFAVAGSIQIVWLAHPFMLLGFVLCFGTAFGGFVTIQQSMWADYFGRASVGSIRGLTLPVQLMGNAFGPFLASFAYDMTGSYALPFWSFVAVSALGVITMLLAKKPKFRPVRIPQEAAVA